MHRALSATPAVLQEQGREVRGLFLHGHAAAAPARPGDHPARLHQGVRRLQRPRRLQRRLRGPAHQQPF